MGTDVHGIFQAKKDGRWVDIPHRWEQNRHYVLFAWLANVRNGYGFAGHRTHAPIEPLSEPRGLPPDFEIVGYYEHPTDMANWDPRRVEYSHEPDERSYDMGDHNFSWLTADEILSGKRPCGLARTGVVDLEWFKGWDGVTSPQSWNGFISGPGIVVSDPDNITPATTHVRINWTDDDDGLGYFVEEVRRLRDEFGDVRLVFGFDS